MKMTTFSTFFIDANSRKFEEKSVELFCRIKEDASNNIDNTDLAALALIKKIIGSANEAERRSADTFITKSGAMCAETSSAHKFTSSSAPIATGKSKKIKAPTENFFSSPRKRSREENKEQAPTPPSKGFKN